MSPMSVAAILALVILIIGGSKAQSCSCDSYEDNSNFATAAAVPATFRATICPAFDVDHYFIGTSTSSSYLSINITQYVSLSADSFLLVKSFISTGSHLISAPAGRHYLKCYARHPLAVTAAGISYGVETSWTEGLCATDAGESNNIKETALPISVPLAPLTAYLCPTVEDEDWYSFTSASYQSIQLQAKASSAADLYDTEVDGVAGIEVVAWNPRGDRYNLPLNTGMLNVTMDLMPGVYFLQFRAVAGSELDPPPSLYTFTVQTVAGSCVAISTTAGTSLATATLIGTSSSPTRGSFCPVDAEFFVYFDVTEAAPLQDYSFTQPNRPAPTLTLIRDGVEIDLLLARQIPGAAGGGYAADRSLLTPGRYYIRTRSAGFTAYDWQMSLLQSDSSFWVEDESTPPSPDANEPNNAIAAATAISLPYVATSLNLFPSFERDWFKFTLTQTSNVFVALSTKYPVTEYVMSPYYTSPEAQTRQAAAQFYTSGGALIATFYSNEEQFLYAHNVGPGDVFMAVFPARRAPGHVAWQYNVSVTSSFAVTCAPTVAPTTSSATAVPTGAPAATTAPPSSTYSTTAATPTSSAATVTSSTATRSTTSRLPTGTPTSSPTTSSTSEATTSSRTSSPEISSSSGTVHLSFLALVSLIIAHLL